MALTDFFNVIFLITTQSN